MSHPAAAPLPPLRRQVRWRILALLFAITVIAFIDRQTLSVAARLLRNTFHLSNTDYGRIVSAFMLGMTAAEAPIGWWISPPRRPLGSLHRLRLVERRNGPWLVA